MYSVHRLWYSVRESKLRYSNVLREIEFSLAVLVTGYDKISYGHYYFIQWYGIWYQTAVKAHK